MWCESGRKEIQNGGNVAGIRIEMSDKRQKSFARELNLYACLYLYVHFMCAISTNHRRVLLSSDVIQQREKTRACDVKHHIHHITKTNEFDVGARD